MSLALVLVLMAGLLVAFASAAQAQVEDTGASATKVCAPAVAPDFYTIGETVPCTALFANTGASNATVTDMTDIAPFIGLNNPGNGAPFDIECTLIVGGTVIGEGDTLAPGQLCRADFLVQIPNNVAFCNAGFRDLASISLSYPLFDPPLDAFAGASATTAVVCPPTITVAKTADALGKITDPVNYTIEVCNTGVIPVTKTSVTDSLIPAVDAAFGATLAPGACETESFQRVVQAGDPDPVVNTVTAIYTAGTQTATATDSATTNLFQPSVDVTKSCSPNPNQVGGTSTCIITVANTSSNDSPNLVNGSIVDTLSGNLLDAGNTGVVSSTCSAVLPTGGSCTITTARVIQAGDPNPVVNTVTVHYNPEDFPNDITDNASASVDTVAPDITVTKMADALSKATDPVNYTIEVCNAGTFGVTRTSVIDSLIGDVSADFAASLAPGGCSSANFTRTVLNSDPDPLVNTVTAIYSGAGASDTASASASTNLFQPAVDVTKSCGPDPIQVGQAELCAIVIDERLVG